MKLSKPLRTVIWLIFVCVFAVPATNGAHYPALIPQPVSLELAEGAFEIGPATRVVARDSAGTEAGKLIEDLSPAMGFRLKFSKGRTEQNAN